MAVVRESLKEEEGEVGQDCHTEKVKVADKRCPGVGLRIPPKRFVFLIAPDENVRDCESLCVSDQEIMRREVVRDWMIMLIRG